MNADVPAAAAALQAPRPAAVGRYIKAVGGRGVEDRLLFRIDDEIVKADTDQRRRRQHFPRRAAVGGFVHAGAEIVVEVALAASGIDLLRVGGVERDRADRERRHLIGSRPPRSRRRHCSPKCPRRPNPAAGASRFSDRSRCSTRGRSRRRARCRRSVRSGYSRDRWPAMSTASPPEPEPPSGPPLRRDRGARCGLASGCGKRGSRLEEGGREGLRRRRSSPRLGQGGRVDRLGPQGSAGEGKARSRDFGDRNGGDDFAAERRVALGEVAEQSLQHLAAWKRLRLLLASARVNLYVELAPHWILLRCSGARAFSGPCQTFWSSCPVNLCLVGGLARTCAVFRPLGRPEVPVSYRLVA